MRRSTQFLTQGQRSHNISPTASQKDEGVSKSKNSFDQRDMTENGMQIQSYNTRQQIDDRNLPFENEKLVLLKQQTIDTLNNDSFSELTVVEQNQVARLVSYIDQIQHNDSTDKLPTRPERDHQTIRARQFKNYQKQHILGSKLNINNDLMMTLKREESVIHTAKVEEENGPPDMAQKYPMFNEMVSYTSAVVVTEPEVRKPNHMRMNSFDHSTQELLQQMQAKVPLSLQSPVSRIEASDNQMPLVSPFRFASNEQIIFNEQAMGSRKISASVLPTINGNGQNKSIGNALFPNVPVKTSGNFRQSKSQLKVQPQKHLESLNNTDDNSQLKAIGNSSSHASLEIPQQFIQIKATNFEALKSETSNVKDLKVNAKVSFDNIPTQVQLQKNMQAQMNLLNKVQQSWEHSQQMRVQGLNKQKVNPFKDFNKTAAVAANKLSLEETNFGVQGRPSELSARANLVANKILEGENKDLQVYNSYDLQGSPSFETLNEEEAPRNIIVRDNIGQSLSLIQETMHFTNSSLSKTAAFEALETKLHSFSVEGISSHVDIESQNETEKVNLQPKINVNQSTKTTHLSKQQDMYFALPAKPSMKKSTNVQMRYQNQEGIARTMTQVQSAQSSTPIDVNDQISLLSKSDEHVVLKQNPLIQSEMNEKDINQVHFMITDYETAYAVKKDSKRNLKDATLQSQLTQFDPPSPALVALYQPLVRMGVGFQEKNLTQESRQQPAQAPSLTSPLNAAAVHESVATLSRQDLRDSSEVVRLRDLITKEDYLRAQLDQQSKNQFYLTDTVHSSQNETPNLETVGQSIEKLQNANVMEGQATLDASPSPNMKDYQTMIIQNQGGNHRNSGQKKFNIKPKQLGDSKRASIYSTVPLTEQSSNAPTVAIPATRDILGLTMTNTDLSELDKSLVKISAAPIKRSMQPSLVKISVRNQEAGENKIGKTGKKKRDKKGVRQSKSKLTLEKQPIAIVELSEASIAVIKPNEEQKFDDSEKVLVNAGDTSARSNELVIVKTDNKGLVTFHNLAKQEKLNYTQVDTQMQTFDVKNSSVMQGSNSNPLLLQPQAKIGSTFYREEDENKNNLEPLYDSYQVVKNQMTQPTPLKVEKIASSNHNSVSNLGVALRNAKADVIKRKQQKPEREAAAVKELILVPSTESLAGMRQRQQSMSPNRTLKPSNTSKRTLNSISPLQQRAKDQSHLRSTQVVMDPNGQLRNAPKGIVANAVRQSLEFKSSLASYDYQRERKLFGKTFKDIVALQAADERRSVQEKFENPAKLYGSTPSKTISTKVLLTDQSQRLHTNISKLEPQGTLLSYQNALGLTRNNSIESIEGHQSSLLQPIDTEKFQKRSSLGQLMPSQQKDFFATKQVNVQRVQLDRFSKCLETQFENKAANLERGLLNQVKIGGPSKKHITGISKGKTSFSMGPGSVSQQSLLGHRQDQMLDRLKVIKKNMASHTDMQQRSYMQVLQDFISTEMQGTAQPASSQQDRDSKVDTMYLPAIGLPPQTHNSDIASHINMSGRRLLNESFLMMKKHLVEDQIPPSAESSINADHKLLPGLKHPFSSIERSESNSRKLVVVRSNSLRANSQIVMKPSIEDVTLKGISYSKAKGSVQTGQVVKSIYSKYQQDAFKTIPTKQTFHSKVKQKGKQQVVEAMPPPTSESINNVLVPKGFATVPQRGQIDPLMMASEIDYKQEIKLQEEQSSDGGEGE